MTSRIELKCINSGQKKSLKSIVFDNDNLYRIIDYVQSNHAGSSEFMYGYTKFNFSFNPSGINLWITDGKVRHYGIIGNGDMVDFWSRRT